MFFLRYLVEKIRTRRYRSETRSIRADEVDSRSIRATFHRNLIFLRPTPGSTWCFSLDRISTDGIILPCARSLEEEARYVPSTETRIPRPMFRRSVNLRENSTNVSVDPFGKTVNRTKSVRKMHVSTMPLRSYDELEDDRSCDNRCHSASSSFRIRKRRAFETLIEKRN